MKIGAFAELTGISAYTLRYYEKKGLLAVQRDQNGCRNYMEADKEWVQFLCKLKATGMLLRDIKNYARLRYAGAGRTLRAAACASGVRSGRSKKMAAVQRKPAG